MYETEAAKRADSDADPAFRLTLTEHLSGWPFARAAEDAPRRGWFGLSDHVFGGRPAGQGVQLPPAVHVVSRIVERALHLCAAGAEAIGNFVVHLVQGEADQSVRDLRLGAEVASGADPEAQGNQISRFFKAARLSVREPDTAKQTPCVRRGGVLSCE